jgi:hypothetical protein
LDRAVHAKPRVRARLGLTTVGDDRGLRGQASPEACDRAIP